MDECLTIAELKSIVNRKDAPKGLSQELIGWIINRASEIVEKKNERNGEDQVLGRTVS